MATLLQLEQFFDNAGEPLSSGVIEAFEAKSSTTKNMFSDQGGTVLGTTYTLSASGRVPSTGIWLDGSYKLIIKDSGGSTLYTFDDFNEYDQLDWGGLTATIADLNSTATNTITRTGTSSITAAERGKTILANSAGGNVTLNLLDAAVAGNKFIVRVKKIDNSTNYVTINPAASQTLDGLTTYILLNYLDSMIIQSDGSNWQIIAIKLRDSVGSLTVSKVLKLANDIRVFLCDATSGTINLTLPNPVTVGKGWRVGAKKVDSSANPVIFLPDGSETIDGASSSNITSQYGALELITDGLNWFVVNEFGSISASAYPVGHITGFKMWQDSGDPNHDIATGIGSARSSDNTTNLTLASIMVKRIDANWVQGTGNGGFPNTLSLTPSTWYNEFLIGKNDGTTDIGFDTSITAVNLLADTNVLAASFTKYKYVNSFFVNSSNNIDSFSNDINGDESRMRWIVPAIDWTQLNAVTGTYTANLRVPPGIPCKTNISLKFGTVTGVSGLFTLRCYTPDATAGNGIEQIGHECTTARVDKIFGNVEVMSDASANISIDVYKQVSATVYDLTLTTWNWIPLRG